MCYGAGELVGLHFLTLIRPDYRNQVGEAYARQLQERTPSTYLEFPALTKAGETIWFGQHVQLVHDAGEKIVGVRRSRAISLARRRPSNGCGAPRRGTDL